MHPLACSTESISAGFEESLRSMIQNMFGRFYVIPNFMIATSFHQFLSSLSKWLPDDQGLQELVASKLEICLVREWPDICDSSVIHIVCLNY